MFGSYCLAFCSFEVGHGKCVNVKAAAGPWMVQRIDRDVLSKGEPAKSTENARIQYSVWTDDSNEA